MSTRSKTRKQTTVNGPQWTAQHDIVMGRAVFAAQRAGYEYNRRRKLRNGLFSLAVLVTLWNGLLLTLATLGYMNGSTDNLTDMVRFTVIIIAIWIPALTAVVSVPSVRRY